MTSFSNHILNDIFDNIKDKYIFDDDEFEKENIHFNDFNSIVDICTYIHENC